jgi:GTP-binding protein HflX
MIGERIKTLKARLDRVKRQHGTQSRARKKSGTFRVSLVGYTNAGKSTLFNALVKARAYAADQLFATLDTTTRTLWLDQAGRTVTLSDTVGFIRDLPHKLVQAFRATLQEAAEADLLLHVVDASSPQQDEQRAEVERVLAEIGADAIPQILVYNKLDRIAPSQRPRSAVDWIEREHGVRAPRVFTSALDGAGLDALRDLIAQAAGGALEATESVSVLDAEAPAEQPLRRSLQA